MTRLVTAISLNAAQIQLLVAIIGSGCVCADPSVSWRIAIRLSILGHYIAEATMVKLCICFKARRRAHDTVEVSQDGINNGRSSLCQA
jgi:hypothetical protein